MDEVFERPSDSEKEKKEKELSHGSLFEAADGEGWQDDRTVRFVKNLLTNKKGRLYHVRSNELKGEEEILAQWRGLDRPALQRLEQGESRSSTRHRSGSNRGHYRTWY